MTTSLIIHLGERLLSSLLHEATPSNRASLAALWRTCLTIHDLAEANNNRAYVALMERFIDAIGDYETFSEPEDFDWQARLPSVREIEAAAQAQ